MIEVKEKIPVPSEVQYITQWTDQFGNFVLEQILCKGRFLLNKDVTGCGFTTWVLANRENSILVSPRKALIRNKLKSFPDCFYFDVEHYRLDDLYNLFCVYQQMCTSPLKIMVTYDSFDKLADMLEYYGYDIGNQFRISIDESHCLIKDVQMKENADRFVLSTLLARLFRYDNLLFASATPIVSYMSKIKEFQQYQVDYYELEWTNKEPMIKLPPETCKSPLDAFNHIYDKYSKHTDANGIHVFDVVYGVDNTIYSYEACIFLNSVSDICKILKKYTGRGLIDPADVSVICADNSKNQTKLSKVHRGLTVMTDIPGENDAHTTWTFVTRTSFEGTDFHSSNASTYVIANYNVESLQLDIASDIHQIVGRQRDVYNSFRNTVHIFYTNGKNSISDEEFAARQQQKETMSENQIQLWNSAPSASTKDTQLQNIKLCIENDPTKWYLRVVNGIPEINDLMKVSEEYCRDILKNQQYWFIPSPGNSTVYTTEVEQLREKLYYLVSDNIMRDRIHEVYGFIMTYPMLRNETYRMLHDEGYNDIAGLFCATTIDRICACGYDPWKIKQEIFAQRQKLAIIQAVQERFVRGNTYTNKEVKQLLGEAYQEVGINKTAVATDLPGYLQCTVKKSHGKYTIL